MILFLDTEFTSFEDPALISIGMVSQDGQFQFYSEVCDYDRSSESEFVRTTVLPLLSGENETLQSLKTSISNWFETLPRSVMVACDSDFDRKLFSSLFDKLPENFNGFIDLSPFISDTFYHKAVEAYHKDPQKPWHHAFHDACAHRAGWMAKEAKKRRACY